MPEAKRLVLFCEDDEHEAFVRELVRRLCKEIDLPYSLSAPSARGGHPQALAALRAWQKSLNQLGGAPDLLVVLIDANCKGWGQVRQDLVTSVDAERIPNAVIGCPDPHLERWLIADPAAFQEVVGTTAGADPGKCDRTFYKELLARRIAAGTEVVITGPRDLIPDIIESMDLFQAGKRQPSLKHFIDDLSQAIKRLAV